MSIPNYPNYNFKSSEINLTAKGDGDSSNPESPPSSSSSNTSLQETQSSAGKFLLELLNFQRKGIVEQSDAVPTSEPARDSEGSPEADQTVPLLAIQDIPSSPIEPHEEYYTYTKFPINYNHELVDFFIDADLRKGVITPGYEFFEVCVRHPSGDLLDFTIKLDTAVPCRYVCTFKSAEPGIYPVTVRFGNEDVNGSPFNCLVSRHYSNLTPQTIVEAKDPGENSKVWGIDVDRVTGRMYVTDMVTNQVHVFNRDGVHIAEFGRSILRGPCGIAVDRPNNRIIVASKENHRIYFFTLEGCFIWGFGKQGTENGQFNYPWGVAVSPCGFLIVVADSMNHRLQTFDMFGDFMNSYSMYAVNPLEYKEEFDYPRGVAFDEKGRNIYAVDFNLHAVFKFDINLKTKKMMVPPGRLLRPQGITVDQAGNLIICDTGHNRVRVVTSYGALLANIRSDGKYSPQDVTILPTGQVAILNRSGVIRVY